MKLIKTVFFAAALTLGMESYAQLPDYYDRDFLDTTYKQIKAANNTASGVSFGFITDIHCLSNRFNSKYLLKDVLDKANVPFILCGGDFVSAYGEKDDVLAAGEKCFEYQDFLGHDKFFPVRGNHDYTVREGPGKSGGFTAQHDLTYDFVCEGQQQYVGGMDKDHLCYYVDVPEQKTRFICINSCDGQTEDENKFWGVKYVITQGQVDWILNKALDVQGYKLFFISHIPADPAQPSYHKSQDVIHKIQVALQNRQALDFTADGVTARADFSKSTNEVVCHVSGHCHMDSSNVDEGVLSITVTCDAHYQDDGAHCKKGTMNEHAFDVFCVDYDKREIRAIRVGRGCSRSWKF